MIPKTIHYCWFGRGELPKSARKCMRSWRKHFPDYEIKVWNEDNFDVSACSYVSEAYALRKYAFVSDYARFWVLYHHGGVYFDTDVEVVKSFDDILAQGSFMGIEKSLATEQGRADIPVGVNPGLGFAAEKGLPLLKEILDYYDTLHYTPDGPTIVAHTTDVLARHGFRNSNERQSLAGITVYPTDYFCPMDSTTGIITRTANTRSIHHYTCSWMDRRSLSFRLHLLKNALIRVFGPKTVMKIASMVKK